MRSPRSCKRTMTKLSRTVLARDLRRLDDESLNSWRDRFCLHDWEQVAPLKRNLYRA
jgi:hypothetical protein